MDLLSDAMEKPFTSRQFNNWGRIRTAIGFILLAFLVLSSNSGLIKQNSGAISVVDEFWYVDYVIRAVDGDIARPGDDLSQKSLDYLSCHTVEGVLYGSGCGNIQKLGDFPLGGKTAAEIHPPTYFVITASIANAIKGFIGFDLVDSARLVGSLWLLAGLAIWLVCFRLIGVRLIASFAIVSLVAFSPLVMSVTNYLSPDATFAISSGIIWLAVILWSRNQISVWWLLLAGAIPVAFKVTHLLGPISAALFILLLWFTSNRAKFRRYLLASSLMISGSLAGLVIWQSLRSLLRVSASPSHGNNPTVNLPSLIGELGYHITRLPLFSGASLQIPKGTYFVGGLFMILLIAAAVGGVLYQTRKTEVWAISVAATLNVFFGAVLLSTITLALSGGVLVPMERYGLPFLLLWTMPLALAVKNKTSAAIVASLAVLSVVASYT